MFKGRRRRRTTEYPSECPSQIIKPVANSTKGKFELDRGDSRRNLHLLNRDRERRRHAYTHMARSKNENGNSIFTYLKQDQYFRQLEFNRMLSSVLKE